MADSKITALTALTAADPVNDMFLVVDVSDTSMAASGTTKRISANNILSSSPTASGALTVTGLVTAGSATITGALGAAGLNVTGATIPANGVYLGSANNLSFSAASTLGMTLNATGLNIANGNVILGTSGTGIDFSATSSNGTSELLNDYEEGTWTGTITGGTFTNLTTGRYTKIGRQVFASITPNTTNITGNLVISGLPFTAGSRSAMVAATAPPAGVTYSPRFVDATDIYVNVVGVYAAGSVSTYFAFTYDV